MVTIKRFTFLGLSCLILTACHLVARSPTSTPTPLIPSPNPSAPVLPTPVIPPLAVLTEYLNNVQIVNVDTFTDPSGWDPGSGISNGELLLTGVGGNDWHGLSNRAILREDNGVMINFQFTPGEYFEMYFEREPWRTSLYKRFGVYVQEDHANVDIFIGRRQREPTPIAGTLSFTPGTWYSLLLAIGTGGDFLAVIWEPAHPENRLQYREAITNWQGLDWTFRMQVNQGSILFDDFEAIAFDSIR